MISFRFEDYIYTICEHKGNHGEKEMWYRVTNAINQKEQFMSKIELRDHLRKAAVEADADSFMRFAFNIYG